MANNQVRGITIEIGGDTSKLGKALQNAETQSRNLQKELKQINAALKMDPSNVELAAQKQKVLKEHPTVNSKWQAGWASHPCYSVPGED